MNFIALYSVLLHDNHTPQARSHAKHSRHFHLEDVEPHKLPTCSRPDPTNLGRPYPAASGQINKGGVTDDLGIKYIKSCVEPSLPGLSKDDPVILIMDGHGSHFTFELLTHCREIGLHILLRPPHTTHVLQGEDVVNFALFKRHRQKDKLVALASKIAHERVAQLSPADLLLCARDAWQNAFSQASCLKAWAETGLVPFTRNVYFDLLERRSARRHMQPHWASTWQATSRSTAC